MQNFIFWTAQVKFQGICSLIGSFCWKYIEFQLKMYSWVVSWYWRVMENLKKNRLAVSKNDKNLMNFYHSEVSKICILIGPFRARCITFGLKEYREVIFHGNEELRKIWTKTDLWLGKWQEEFGKFSSEHLKVSKLLLSWDTFVQSTKYMCNDIEEWWKIWSGIELLFQNWHKEFDEFWLGHLKSLKNLHFNGLLLTKVYNVWAKKEHRSPISWH